MTGWLKLSLSNIVNLVHPESFEDLKKIFTKGELDTLDNFKPNSYIGLSQDNENLLQQAVESGGPDQMMIKITIQLELSKAGEKKPDTYKMLNMLKSIFESFEIFSDNDSELTSYRHCAKILDCLFNGTNLKILHGETVCIAAKEQMIVNHPLFPSTDESALSTCSIRKIDTIVVADIENERMELPCNEWKKSSASVDAILKQQSKTSRLISNLFTALIDTLIAIQCVL